MKAKEPSTDSTPARPAALPGLRRILVPVDFSACSGKALDYAVTLARQFDAAVVLLYVIEPFVPVPELTSLDVEAVLKQMRDSATSELTKWWQGVPSDIRAEKVLREGKPHSQITKAAVELKADLIVIATHGRTGVRHLLMGSTAENVIRHAPCPTLVVREHEHEFIEAPTRGKVPRHETKAVPVL